MKTALFLKILLLSLGLGIFSSIVSTYGGIKLRNEMENFRLPFFDSKGNRIWDLTVKKSHRINDKAFALQGISLRIFSSKSKQRENLIVKTASGTLFPQEKRIQGADYVQINSEDEGFTLRGRRWKFDSQKKQLIIESKVKANLYKSIDIFEP